MSIPDHPAIVEMERNGYPEATPVCCPVCGGECETLYIVKKFREVVGCDLCIETADPMDV